jgi:hypothetical protein
VRETERDREHQAAVEKMNQFQKQKLRETDRDHKHSAAVEK